MLKGKYFSIETDKHGDEFIRCSNEVLMVALDSKDNIYLIREYAPAMGKEVLILPGGSIEKGEQPVETGNRELQEEIGRKAKTVELIGELHPWSKYITLRSYICLGRGMSMSKLNGDEKEAPKLEKVKLKDFEELIANGRINDARVIAALYMARAHINKNGKTA